jgi:hypothetical protein
MREWTDFRSRVSWSLALVDGGEEDNEYRSMRLGDLKLQR